jgi:ribosome maturation factor RimP
MATSARFPAALDRAALDRVLDPIARAHGAEVVDVELKTEGRGFILRIFVEKAGAAEHKFSTQQAAVDLELCANVARDLSPALDVADLIPHSYSLEVSSPGIERPLRLWAGERDFIRFTGQKAKLKLTSPVAGQKVLVGVLGAIEGGKLRIADGGRVFEVPLADIASARLVFEFGPSPKSQRKSQR